MPDDAEITAPVANIIVVIETDPTRENLVASLISELINQNSLLANLMTGTISVETSDYGSFYYRIIGMTKYKDQVVFSVKVSEDGKFSDK